MPYAQYDLITGAIAAVNSSKVSDKALAAMNRAQVEVGWGITGESYSIDLNTRQPILLPPSLPPVPDLAIQLAALLIASGTIKQDALQVDVATSQIINDHTVMLTQESTPIAISP